MTADLVELTRTGFDEAIEEFYAGAPEKVYRDLPYSQVVRPVRAALRDDHNNTLTWYERTPGRCFLLHTLEVIADYWVGFRLGRRLECQCGKVKRIEVY